MSNPYSGKNVLVTGASSGIGRAVSEELARRGAMVIAVARRRPLLDELVAEITAAGGKAMAIACDITQEDQVGTMVETVRDACGELDLLVNNAGKQILAPLQTVRPAAARDLFELNVVAMANVIRSCLGLLKKGAAIVNISSVAGLQGSAGLSLYGASKAAVIALSQSLARELAGRRIRVNAIAPGYLRTEMSEAMFRRLTPEQVQRIEADHPLGFGTPRDVACAVAFLGSDDASWITGHTLVVDGGYSA